MSTATPSGMAFGYARVSTTQQDEALQRDLQTIMGQAQRVIGLLDKMRSAANERLREMADTMHQEGIPTSPEAEADGKFDV